MVAEVVAAKLSARFIAALPSILAGAAVTGGLITAHILYSGHYVKKGVAKCEAAQVKANKKTIPITDDITTKKDDAQDVFETKTDTIRTETVTGITALDMARATREAQNTGEELGRAKAIAEYRAQGGCMSDPLPNDDGLLIVGQNQQRAIFGRVVGSGENAKTGTVRQDAPADDVP